jgi:LPS-assembly lipoprotein
MAAALMPLLAGCGFHPLYSQTGNPQAFGQFAAITVTPIPEDVGYELRNDLLDLFASQASAVKPLYQLSVGLDEKSAGVALRNNADITRYNYTLTAHYQLVSLSDQKMLTSGNITTFTAYNVASSPYATVSAERDAKTRAASDVAERIRTELAVYFYNRDRAPAGQNAAAPSP